MSELAEKVKASVERMKAFEPPEGYLLAFSGGKDSVVLKALADMAGVKYRAHYTVSRSGKVGSKTFPGIAAAMAEQWGGLPCG